MKILKAIAIRCHILMLKCIKFDFGFGAVPQALLAELYSASEIPYSPVFADCVVDS